ncbi:SulP family inorganic anion transporter [Streptomyces sp. NPDC002055]|uniref:SulP family inorganic anion transporter n=1 Tax=Streptomyces sp. NPDC002055 TaxID=3154534 RepID=UPI00332C4F42
MFPPAFGRDLGASVVVFLVALPLCVGVAVASGLPAEAGLITGIVGGLVVGMLPGSSLQVSGPAAGLTVLVFEAVKTYGVAALAVIVVAAGLLQVLLGALRMGRWFRAVSVSVVEGMLAGVGLVIIAGQLYALADRTAPTSGLGKITGLPGLVAGLFHSPQALAALALGAGTIAVMVLWRRVPRPLRAVPGPLVAVVLATGASLLFAPDVKKVQVHGLLASVHPVSPGDFGQLAQAGVLGTVLAFTLIASAESLFSAAAVDRLHNGPRTDYDKELMAQGVGNTLCGVLGALPMTAVIVRSSANVHAGARTKASRVLHGVWLLLFAALLPFVLAVIPVAALAGVLVHAGWKLLPLGRVRSMWREHRSETAVLIVTALAIVLAGMFEGVLIGLALSVAKSAWETSHLRIRRHDGGSGPIRVALSGNATFLRLPVILDALEALPSDRPVELDLSGVRHIDHACTTALAAWTERHNRTEPQAHIIPEPVGAA